MPHQLAVCSGTASVLAETLRILPALAGMGISGAAGCQWEQNNYSSSTTTVWWDGRLGFGRKVPHQLAVCSGTASVLAETLKILPALAGMGISGLVGAK